MSIRALKTFLAINTYGSFSAASEVLGLTQSAVSLQIKKLEQDLETVLFDRSGHRSVLNAQGRALLPKAEELVMQYERLGGALHGEDGYAGPVNIGAIITMQVGPLPRVMQALRQQHPRLHPILRSGMSGELAVDVEAGRLDFALTTEPQMILPSSMVWQACYDELFYILSPTPFANTSARDVLTSEPFVRFDRLAWIGRMVDQHLRQEGIAPRDVMETDSLETALQMVRAGIGVTVLPLPRRRAQELALDMGVMALSEPPLQRGLGILSKRDSQWNDLIATCVALLRDQAL